MFKFRVFGKLRPDRAIWTSPERSVMFQMVMTPEILLLNSSYGRAYLVLGKLLFGLSDDSILSTYCLSL